MFKKERLSIIMREVNLHNKVLSADLAIMLSVSDDTIRRDIIELFVEGQLIKVHGGAVSKSFALSLETQDQVYALEAKRCIAEKAYKLLKNNQSIIMEGGTTILEFAKYIPKKLKLTCFTISPQVSLLLSNHENVKVISLGGLLKKNANIYTGSNVINTLASLKFDLCLLGANALSIADGLTDNDWEVAQVKQALLRTSKKTAVLSVSEKLNTCQKVAICETDKIDYLITEIEPNHHSLIPYQSLGITVI